MSHPPPFKPSGFTQKEYRKLWEISPPFLKSVLYSSDYRDKRIQRHLTHWEFRDAGALEALKCPLDEMPLYINSPNDNVVAIAKWRLLLNK
jgi:hypothetical protein